MKVFKLLYPTLIDSYVNKNFIKT